MKCVPDFVDYSKAEYYHQRMLKNRLNAKTEIVSLKKIEFKAVEIKRESVVKWTFWDEVMFVFFAIGLTGMTLMLLREWSL
jgi:hypothetical protein